MAKFMDVHEMPGVTIDQVEMAHKKDLEIQGRHGVKFMRYWVDEKNGRVFCLSDAPNAKAALAVHEEAGHPPKEIFQVHEGR